MERQVTLDGQRRPLADLIAFVRRSAGRCGDRDVGISVTRCAADNAHGCDATPPTNRDNFEVKLLLHLEGGDLPLHCGRAGTIVLGPWVRQRPDTDRHVFAVYLPVLGYLPIVPYRRVFYEPAQSRLALCVEDHGRIGHRAQLSTFFQKRRQRGRLRAVISSAGFRSRSHLVRCPAVVSLRRLWLRFVNAEVAVAARAEGLRR
mmetsp:Transcript_26094/g.72968  ORF Transcript_26094/g.72968 Transcript_26094/m.72968 type:complete len:203 (+) Transcript_26094:754-1362(+)